MMRRLCIAALAWVLPVVGVPCDMLKQTRIKNNEIVSAEQVTSGSYATASGLPAFCRVVTAARPSSDSQIGIEVWLPVEGWNGRALGTGNGGFAGKISYNSLANGLKLGYAVANTDMGMAVPVGADASVFIGRPDRWRDWGYRATHEMTLTAAALIQAYYGHGAAHSYFSGCSTGGEQALMEAQRFPNDYDGIVAGAPANNRTGVHLSILWNYMAVERDESAYLPAAKLAVLHQAVVKACNMNDPLNCTFDPGTLLCKGSDSADCLSAAQVETARRVYAGPVDPANGRSWYPGAPRGSELDWTKFGPAPGQQSDPPFAPIFKWVFGADWDWHSFNLSNGPKLMEQKLGKDLNATDGNLNRFRSHGGKLIAYHGLADYLVVPGEALRYRTALLNRTKGNLDEFYRLYFIPGMSHCGGGTGPSSVDTLTPLVDWVEKNVAPEDLTGIRGEMRTSICAYPKVCSGTYSMNQP